MGRKLSTFNPAEAPRPPCCTIVRAGPREAGRTHASRLDPTPGHSGAVPTLARMTQQKSPPVRRQVKVCGRNPRQGDILHLSESSSGDCRATNVGLKNCIDRCRARPDRIRFHRAARRQPGCRSRSRNRTPCTTRSGERANSAAPPVPVAFGHYDAMRLGEFASAHGRGAAEMLDLSDDDRPPEV
jgi:hypothetical protein